MSSTLPHVAVIVPVYDGAATIGDCVDSLLRLDYPAARHEIIVVDNASTDATPRILADYGGQIRVRGAERRGPAAARNAGMRATTANVVAFTDADCTVDPGWLRALIAPLIDPSIGVAGGRIRIRQPRNHIEAFGAHVHDHAGAIDQSSPPYAFTMSWASRREVLESVGGFNESLLHGSGIDAAWRLLTAGYRLLYVPEAIVQRPAAHTMWGLLRAGYLHGSSMTRVRALHAALVARAGQRRSAPAPAPLPADEALPAHWSNAVWRTLFQLGDGAGRAAASWRDR
jgi:cellulose synthase/poly-beta-1,6-N-acetylglucosamine synthase-like glycosyltransferase